MRKKKRISRATLLLNPTQYDALELFAQMLAKIVWYIGGVGSGKSFVLGVFVYDVSRLPKSLCLLTAPVLDTLNNSTLPGVLDAWDRLGIVEGRDYVFGAAPKSWKVPAYQKLRNAKVITWRNGSYTLLDGSDNYPKHRGLELDAVAIDELGNLKPGAAKVYTGRLRGKARKRKKIPSVMFGVGNPPEDPYLVEEWQGKPGCVVLTAASHENAKNLPDDYIALMEATYDDVTYRREVLGELIAIGGLVALSSYTPLPYPKGNYCDLEFSPTAKTYMTCDFNASSERPMSWILEQELWVGEQILSVAVMEFVNLGTSTRTQCKIVRDYLLARGFTGELHVRGDATGADKARNSTTAESDYEEIDGSLSKGPWRYKGKLTRRTKRVKNRVAAHNARLRTRDGKISLLINPLMCPKLDEAAKRLRWANNQYELEDNPFKDPVDAWTYRSYRDYPIHRKRGKVKRRAG